MNGRRQTILLFTFLLFSSFLYLTSLRLDLFIGNVTPRAGEETILIASQRHGDYFCVAYNVTMASKSFNEDGLEPITFATHATSNYLGIIVNEQAKNWNAPISMAMFIDPSSHLIIEFAYNIHRCRKEITKKLSIHIVFRNAAFDKKCPKIPIRIQTCSTFSQKYVSNFLKKIRPPFAIYPINVMRNVARIGSPSPIMFLADVEMIFSENFPLMLKKAANHFISSETKTRIVIRRFEQETKDRTVARNHIELKKKMDNKTVFEFHHKLFPAGHKIAGLPHWFAESSANPQLVVWEIPYKGPSWEPQIILHSTDPLSEENVPTRWRDQQVLTYELCRANYTFLLASHVFNVHRGVKRSGTHLDEAIKKHQQPLKKAYLAAFIKRMNKTYPSTASRCRKFIM